MKTRSDGVWRGIARLPLAAGALAAMTAVWAAGGVAVESGEPGLRPAGPGPEGLRLESLVSALRTNGAEVLSLGSRGGLDGYFVTPAKGAGYSLYVTADGHAVAGLLYGPDGTEVTGSQLAAARSAAALARGADGRAPETAPPAAVAHTEIRDSVAAPGPASLAGLFERSASAFGFTLGERGPVAVLLGDPTCSWSRSAAAKLGRAALDGRLQLRVVPVAVLGGAAARRAAGIAASPDPAIAWFEGGGTADRTGAERIARNNALFDEWGASAVPLIAWRTREGTVAHRVGDIDDVGAWLKDTLRVGDARAGDGP